MHGDPETNAKSDRKVTAPNGETVALRWEPQIWTLRKQKATAKQRFHGKRGGDDIEQALRQDRFHSVGQKMLGAWDSKLMPWRQKAHGGPKDGAG